ncbi:sensor histidine kinase [Olivibacter domesticus]|uniref:Histidine kinase n=1 Tax=Olivibacter domesticus TaxID=407022 RepID=A0A1H7GHK1_OLID1|nr:histidine kinase [Olivibacter domesticus]SEK37706.1 Histidine kinase [Olivibacter domesticus]
MRFYDMLRFPSPRSKGNQKVGLRLTYHFCFWLLIMVVYYFNYYRLVGNAQHVWIFVLKEMTVVMAAFYSLSSRKVVKIFSNPLGILYVLLWIVVLYVLWALTTYIACLLFQSVFKDYGPRFGKYLELVLADGPFGIVKNIYIFALDFIFLISLPVGPKFVKIMLEQVLTKTKLERDNLELELNFLKSQVNPHFLFNTLNNIYQLLEIDYDKGRDMVLRLSTLMRYTLYESKNHFIPLRKELDFIRDFITLMRIRYGKRVNIEEHIIDVKEPYKISPLMLIPFVENAFKHGPDKSPNNNFVSINLTLEDDFIILKAINAVDGRQHTAEENVHSAIGGVGLSNILRRLDLHYRNKYELTYGVHEGQYLVNLKINLKFS